MVWLTSLVDQNKLLAAVAEARCPAVAFVMHDVPFGTVVELVRKAFRVTSKQLLAAAQCRVSGLEVWALAARQLGVPRGLCGWCSVK